MPAAAHARNLLGPLLHRYFRISVTGGHRFPRKGGLLIVAEQHGILDPMILSTCLQRPVRWMIHDQGASPRLAGVSQVLGRIDVPGHGSPWPALREAVEAIRHGEAVGVFTESALGVENIGPPAALASYLHARTGAPILPVTLIGAHGRRPTDPPSPRARIGVVVDELIEMEPPSDPVNRDEIVWGAESIRQALADAQQRAHARQGVLDSDAPHSGG